MTTPALTTSSTQEQARSIGSARGGDVRIAVTAQFKDGFVAVGRSRQQREATYAWRASGVLASGKPWATSGFSKSEAGALSRLCEQTRHYPRQGAKILFSEIVPVTLSASPVPREQHQLGGAC
jgi:hypothetical protein